MIGRRFGPTPSYPRVLSHTLTEAPELRYIAGPCSVESAEMMCSVASAVKEMGATMLRGGCYRYGTYPPDNPGFDPERCLWLKVASKRIKLPFVVEIMDYDDLPYAYDAEWIQIGMRHAQHYPLLRDIGKLHRKVLLKRGTWMTLDETLGAAEYLLREGVRDVAIVERGVVSFEDHCRWSLSISSIASLKHHTNLKVIVDPSHGSGERSLVPALARAGVAAGADGVLCEVHPDPERSASDAEQAISYDTYKGIVEDCTKIREVLGA